MLFHISKTVCAQSFFIFTGAAISGDTPFCLAGCDSQDDVGLRLHEGFAGQKRSGETRRQAACFAFTAFHVFC